MDLHFKCTQCGRCCHDTRVPLTVEEAIRWLERGHEVQLLCEASPWPQAADDDLTAAHFKRRSFAVMSGSMPARVVVMLVANVVGACPNLLPDMRCGIYDERPGVCRIYPAEINPSVILRPENKACPPEAWTPDQPVLQRHGAVLNERIRQDIRLSRDADAHDADIKRRACGALNIADAALVHEAMLVYSPTAKSLARALAAAQAGSFQESPTHWRFVSTRFETTAALARSGGTSIDLCDTVAASFQHLAFQRHALFGPYIRE